MASSISAYIHDGGTDRLPALQEGRSSLVSPVSAGRQQGPTPREQATAWAADIRQNIDKCVNQHEDVNEDDVTKLKQELIVLFINTLQQDSRDGWSFLCEALQQLQDYGKYLDYFETKAEFHHYLKRILHHVSMHRSQLFDLQVEQHLYSVFPEEVDSLRRQGTWSVPNYSPAAVAEGEANTNANNPSPSPRRSQLTSKKGKKLTLPDGSNPYSPHVLNDKQILGNQALTFGDLRQSLGAVAFEMAARESVWNSCMGTTALALSTNIPEEPKGSQAEPEEIKKLTFQQKKRYKPPPITNYTAEIPKLTGREAVQYFASCNHSGKIKSLYFNVVPSKNFAPYDIISVPESKVSREYFVFSSFGVLHVYPDQPAESMTLSEWQRNAVLWKAISAIPFFKNYLIKKAFTRWRQNKLLLDYQRNKKRVEESLLQAVPAFGAGLLQISRLLKELITVQFLPFETDKTYQLAEFENNVNYKNIQAERIVDKFFKYCKLIVDTIADESFKRVKYYEEQLKKKTFFSKDSMHLQKVKKEEREKNLQKAKQETGRLGNWVKLVDQMVVEHLFHITKTQVLAFTDSVLAVGSAAPRDGFFKANLVFNKQDTLCLSPSKEKFQRTLTSNLCGIPKVLCSAAIPMDGAIPAITAAQSTEKSTSLEKVRSSSAEFKSASGSDSFRKPCSVGEAMSTSQVFECAIDSSSVVEIETGRSFSTIPFRSFTLAEVLSSPSLPHLATPKKSDDDLGVATPDLVLTSRSDRLAVEGEGFVGQYSPLSHASLEDKLALDKEYQAAQKLEQDLMNSALIEVDNYCLANAWLNEIHIFCRRWNDKSIREFRGVAAFTIEQKLTELRQWSEKVRNFDRSFVTDNGLFYVDCSAIHEGLLPRLNDIYQELITFIADEAKNLAASFVEEMKIIAKNMKDKRENVETFAQFAKNYQQYKKNTLQYQQRVEYVKSLYEVIRMSYRQLTAEEERVEEGVWSAWEAFLMQMQEAGEFINTQTPLMSQQLETSFQTLEREARLLTEQATTGKFLDPSQPPLQILKAMKELREKFFRTQLRLQEASQWRETISGEPYNLKFLNEMTVKMDVRQELWKYVEVSQHAIKDWKQMLFKKMNIKKAMEKVVEWQGAASQLRPHLPANDDVLTAWHRSLQDFRKDLPLLYKLANDALKDRHWHTIFLGMNEPFMNTAQFTVAELMAYNLSDNADLIHTVYLSALAEYDLEQQMQNIKRLWEDCNFKLAKHIPDSQYAKNPARRAATPGRKATKLERYRQEKAAAVAGAQRGLDVAADDFYILIEVEELKYQLEDSRISVEAMMQSPFVGDIEDEVKEWCSALREIEEITDLWLVCQKKWLYLLKIFEQSDLYRQLSPQAFKFEAVHTKFKDWMRVVSNDSKVLSVVTRRRGDKGYRLLQGDNLRSLFYSLVQQQEEILKDLEHFLERHRSQFPRLYFLSNADIVDMLGISRSPQALLPFARKCFPGVTDLVFSLPPGTAGLNSALDFALNSDKLRVVSVLGEHQEEISLYTSLDAHPVATTWLHGLQSSLKNTMAFLLQACVQTRVEDGTRMPILILEELSKLAQTPSAASGLTSDIHSKYRHWLLQFPSQCVIIAECILWERSVSRALEIADTEELQVLRSNLSSKVEQYVDVLKEATVHPSVDSEMKNRLYCLLSSLITQNIHHRDVMDSLIQEGEALDSSYDWLCVLKFRMDIRNVLRAKTTSSLSDTGNQTSSLSVPAKTSQHRGRLKKNAEGEPSSLTRTKTTVSTDYQFSPCYVQQLTSSFFYDYEYLGPSASLVITPLTQRALLSLTQSLRTFHCCTLMGPPGTGKTETVRHLAKMLGRCMFTTACTESMTLPIMLQYMTGMVQSGCWMLFDDTDRMTQGLMSVVAQHLDYLHTALRALDVSSRNQYLIRGQPRFDKKTGAGDSKVIRRNSLTTLHPLPRNDRLQESPTLERQRTVPHGFNEKGLVTYFEDTWVAERDQRRHSIEREIEIKESDLYKNNRPPPLFYEHVKSNRRRLEPDYSKLAVESLYVHHVLGNITFNGKLIPASANFGCLMTLGISGAAPINIPDNLRLLMRPCALIKPDMCHIVSVYLQTFAFQHHVVWAQKLCSLLSQIQTQLPRSGHYSVPLQDVRKMVVLAASKLQDKDFALANQTNVEERRPSEAEMDCRTAEEHCLLWAVKETLTSCIKEADMDAFRSLLRDAFSSAAGNELRAVKEEREGTLVPAIREVMALDRLLHTQHLVDKVLQVHTGLEAHRAVLLVGPSGSGKTTSCSVLSRALNLLNYKLFAPDHSSDELTTDRSIIFQSTQKLKILQGREVSSHDSISDDTKELLDGDQNAKSSASTGLKKLKQLKQNIIKTESIQKRVEEQCSGSKGKEKADFPKVDVVRVVPTAMDPKELLGQFCDGIWQGGLLGKIVQDSFFMWLANKTYMDKLLSTDRKESKKQHSPSMLLRWLILDGDLDPAWTEGLKTLYDGQQQLTLASGDRVQMRDTTSLIFETGSLCNASPSAVSQCIVVHFGEMTNHWSSLYHTWKQSSKSRWLLTAGSLKILDDLIQEVFPPTLRFLGAECCTAMLTDTGAQGAAMNKAVSGVMEVSSFFKIFSSLLDRVILRKELEKKARLEESREGGGGQRADGVASRQMLSRLTNSSNVEAFIPHYMDILKGLFAFAYVWAFGGHLHDRYKDKFSKFAQDVLYRAVHSVHLPTWGQVFDYYVDDTSGAFLRWSDRQQDKPRAIGGSFYITPEVECYSYLLDLLMSSNHPVLLAGAPGVGKTSLVNHLVLTKHTASTLVMSLGLTAVGVQASLLGHILEIQSRSMGVMSGPGAGGVSRHLFFIDDLSMAPMVGGYQPSLELVRQALSYGGIFDSQHQVFQELGEASFIAAATLPTSAGSGLGYASHLLSMRLLRQFINITLFTPTTSSLLGLYSRPLLTWLEEFPTYSLQHHREFAKALTLGLLELYQQVRERLRPTPVHAHYTFSLHDVMRVVQGMLLMSPRSQVRKMKVKKKEDNYKGLGRSTSQDLMWSRSLSTSSQHGRQEPGVAAPMMKVVAQLWCHECTRTFSDRLISDEDRSWFSSVLEETTIRNFCSPPSEAKTEMRAISEEPRTPMSGGSPVKKRADSEVEGDSDAEKEGSVFNEDAPSSPESEGGSPRVGQENRSPVAGGAAAAGQDTMTGGTDAQSLGQSVNRNTSVTISLTATGSITADTETAENGEHLSEDEADREKKHDAVERDNAKVLLQQQLQTSQTPSRQQKSKRRHDTPESMETESSDNSSDETSSTEERESPSTVSGKERQKQTEEKMKESDKETPELLAACSDGEVFERKHESVSEGGAPTKAGSSVKRQVSRSKRGVTFKSGLIADKQPETFYGALLALEEIKGTALSLTDFVFSKYLLSCHAETIGQPVEKGYVESSVELLAEALHTCLGQYNEGTSQRLQLVFFTQAVHHAARLSRVLAQPQGHAVLLGMSYCTGRATLARLASYIAHCKVYEPKLQAEAVHNEDVVREHMKRSCHHAGVVGKPTVLLVHEDLGDQFLPDISSLMARGTSPGLYSEDELQTIVGHMMPGGVQTKRVDKIDQAFERFVKRVRQNLHIVVCLNYKGNSFSSDFRSLHDKLQKCPGLVKNAFSVDLYQPWAFSTYSGVAQAWLQDHKSPVKVPWDAAHQMEQISMASDAMAYIHLSAKAAVERQYCHQKEPLRFYSPLTFLEFVHIFKVIAAYIGKIEKAKAVKYERALGKIDEAFDSIADYKREVSDLTPKHKAATEGVRGLVEYVEAQKQHYIQALDHSLVCVLQALDQCKVQEEAIAELQGPLERLRQSAQSEFDKVNPVYIAAQTALNSLNRNDIEELKSYDSPPVQVKMLAEALCLMMGRPHTWADARMMMMDEQFLDNLIFYDKDHIPDEIFNALKNYVENPVFDRENMIKVSRPAASMTQWVKAIHQYSTIHRKMQPHLKNLLEAESKFTKAQSQLGQMRVEAHRIKSALEATIGQHKEALREAKAIEKHIQGIERRIARASNLMENMSMQHFLWRSELRKARRHMLTAPGDALITAACVCYHGPLDDKSRLELITDWLDRCRQGTFHAQAFLDHDPYSMIARLELLLETGSQTGRGNNDDALSEAASRSGETVHSEVSSSLPFTPQVRTFKYMPALYDSSKFYKSELKKTGTVESFMPNGSFEDYDDDEEDLSPLPNRANFTIQDILSDFDELSEWRMHNLPTDLHAVQNALLMRVSSLNRRHCWPLLVDPDNQAEMWVRTLQTSRNGFSASSVAQDMVEEGLPIEKLNQTLEKEHAETQEPPPSRGTVLTFSDVTEYTVAETEYTFTTQTHNSSWRSQQTGDSDEMRPVTSVTNSWDTQFLPSDSAVQRPEGSLWIVEADDPSVNSKLVSAIVHGMTVLVTHLERRPLGAVFRSLLLKQFYVGHDGSKVVRVGDMQFSLHPNFCLYLSTTLPLFLKGDGLHSLPLHRMCIINMAISDEAIINRLLYETMKVERKEFEGQRRSNENDIILHRQKLAQEHEAIREKTLNLDGPLLEDGTMLESLMACQSNVQRNRLILEETRFMGDHLQRKFAHYLPLMMGATVLYNILRRMAVLHPLYYLPFYKFVDIFASVIQSRDRGKGSLGAPQARVQELSDAVTKAVLHHSAMMMFELHYKLLTLLYSLERLRLSRQASSKELSLFVNGFEKRGLDEQALLEQKPAWIDNTAWLDCSILESLHHPLHGLCNSLVTHSQEWREYFQHPVALLNPVPGTSLQELSTFQKCLLWKFCSPDRLSELTGAIVTFELGSAVEAADHYNIKEVYSSSDQCTPVIFVLPTEVEGQACDATHGLPYISPVHEVKRLAREVGMEGKVRIINFGVRSQVGEVRQALDDCIQSGSWLLLQNYHLSDPLPHPFFAMLKELVHWRWMKDEHEKVGEGSEGRNEDHSLVAHSRPSTHRPLARIHPTFRLWITTKTEGQRIIPGILIQHGLRVTCEMTDNFKSTLQKSYRSAGFLFNRWHNADLESERMGKILPLAMLHALLLQQSYYGRLAFVHPHFWTLSDLSAAVDVFRLVVQPLRSAKALDLIGSVYAHHCLDTTDATVVSAISRDLALQALQPVQGETSKRVVLMMQRLLQSGEKNQSLKRTLDMLEELSACTFSIPALAQHQLLATRSRILASDMVQATGSAELVLQTEIGGCVVVREAGAVLLQLLGLLEVCSTVPHTDSQHIMPLDHFFHTELTTYRSLLSQMHKDLKLLLHGVRGEISLTPYLHEILASVCTDQIPSQWIQETFIPDSSLRQWLQSLPERLRLVIDYYYRRPAVLCLSAFLRPDRLFPAVVQTHAKHTFKDVGTIGLTFEIMPASFVAPDGPCEGVHVKGLLLTNASWDRCQGVLAELLPGQEPLCPIPALWVRPGPVSRTTTQPSSDKVFYSCPLFSCSSINMQQDSTLITHISLPTILPPSLWVQQHVTLAL